MTSGVHGGVGALAAARKRVDGLAHNLANASTTGFKRSSAFTHALQTARGHTELVAGTVIDFRQGDLQYTGEPLHLALEGEGFFAVEGENGELYTRDGTFRLDEGGTLTTQDGLPVAWDELLGALDPIGAAPVVGPDGDVSQGDRRVGRLRVARFAAPERLLQQDDGRFAAPADLEVVPHTARIHQGALEGSNVSAVEEMIEMMAAQRAFGSAANVLSLIAETYRRLSRM